MQKAQVSRWIAKCGLAECDDWMNPIIMLGNQAGEFKFPEASVASENFVYLRQNKSYQ